MFYIKLSLEIKSSYFSLVTAPTKGVGHTDTSGSEGATRKRERERETLM